MPLETIFSNEVARIQVDRAGCYLELEWLLPPDSRIFRQINTRAHAYAHRPQVTKWLCDMQQANFVDLADQQWLVQHLFTALNPLYHHEYAYLIKSLTAGVITAYHIRELVEQDVALTAKMKIMIFTEVDLAHQWLFTSVKE